jgi:glycosyltransferase involved in cell wall biosynthesis
LFTVLFMLWAEFDSGPGARDDPLKVGRAGVEVLDPCKSIMAHLTAHRHYDCVIISRPHNWAKAIDAVRRFQPWAVVIYDAEALWHALLRAQLSYASENDKGAVEREFRRDRDLERAIARDADHIVAISEGEARFFAALRSDGRSVSWMPPLVHRAGSRDNLGPSDPRERRGVLFVAGWLAGANSPNADGLTWFAREILALVVAQIPWARVLVTGGGIPSELLCLGGPNLIFLGYVKDLVAAHNSARLAIAPVRYGAGVKQKTMDAMLSGLPLVSTSVGVEGVPLATGNEVDVADDPVTFAEAVCRLLRDDEYWRLKRGAVLGLHRYWAELSVPSWPEVVRA